MKANVIRLLVALVLGLTRPATAVPQNPDTDWFKEAKHGVFMHFLPSAVADIFLAHSLIRSLAEADSERTGVTGISWGGYLTCTEHEEFLTAD